MATQPARVPNRTYTGKPLVEPRLWRRVDDGQGGFKQQDFLPETEAWLEAARTVPHAVLWGETEWHTLNRLAVLIDILNCGETRATAWSEARALEKALWLTRDAREGKVVYVDEEEPGVAKFTKEQLEQIEAAKARRNALREGSSA